MLTQTLYSNPLHPDFLGHLRSPWPVWTRVPLAPREKEHLSIFLPPPHPDSLTCSLPSLTAILNYSLVPKSRLQITLFFFSHSRILIYTFRKAFLSPGYQAL